MVMGSPGSNASVLTVCRRQVGPFHPRAPALSREVIETRHSPLQSGHCCRRAFTHRHHRRGRAPAPAPPPRGPRPPTLRPGARLPLPLPFQFTLCASAARASCPYLLTLKHSFLGSVVAEGVAALTELAEGSPSETHDRARGRRDESLGISSFNPSVHVLCTTSSLSQTYCAYPSPKPLPAQDYSSKAVHPPAGWRPFLGWRPRSASAPL